MTAHLAARVSTSSPRAPAGADGWRRDATEPATHPTARWRDLDWLLLAGVATLLVLGAVLVYAATRSAAALSGGDPAAIAKRFVLNAAIGLLLGALVAFAPPATLRAGVPVVYALALLALVAVASPLGATVNGAHSWIHLPAGFSLQPAELAKVAIVLALAAVLAARRDRAGDVVGVLSRAPADADEPTGRELVLAGVVVAVPVGLVMLQPDLGTAMVFGAIALGVLVVAGVRVRVLLLLAAAATAAAVLAVRAGVLRDYQLSRLAAFADPSLDPLGVGYTTSQARTAIGSGGLTGTGLFHGPVTARGLVPEQHTDFVVTVAGEELGFVGSAFLLLVLGLVIWRALRIAARSDDLYGRLVATGVVAWLAAQSFQNIGMALGIMPVTGIPLPFVSYGGSSAFACLVAVGLLQNIHLRRRRS